MAHQLDETIRLIQASVARLRRRVHLQMAIEWATTGVSLGLFFAAVLLVLAKTGWVSTSVFWKGLAVSMTLPALGALIAWTRPLSVVGLAQRLDRANDLHDRLSTALDLAGRVQYSDFERAQIKDASQYLDTIEVAPAAPFTRPRDLAIALAAVATFGFVAALEAPNHVQPLPPEFVVKYDAVLDPATLAMERERLKALKEVVESLDDPEMSALAEEIEALLDQVEAQEISERDFLEALERIERELRDATSAEEQEKIEEALSEAARKLREEMKRDLDGAPEDARALVDALEKKDLAEAAKAMDELSRKMENDELSVDDLEKLADLMEKFADLIDPDDPALQKLIEENEALVEKLSELFDEGELDAGEKKRLEEEKKRQERLADQKAKHEKSKSNRQLQELRRKTEEMANEARKKAAQKQDPDDPDFKQERTRYQERQKGEEGKEGEGEEGEESSGESAQDRQRGEKGDEGEEGEEKSAREQFRDAAKGQKQEEAREMAREQLEEMKEALRRQSRDSNGDEGEARGEQMKDLLDRAKGKKDGEGEGEPEVGRGEPPQGEGEPPDLEQGEESGGGAPEESDFAGQGEGDRQGGEETKGSGEGRDEKASAIDTGEGKSRSEIIKAASEEGFATTEYKDVYVDYESVVEEVMEKEKIPAGYRFYIKRYFQLIRPQE